MTPVFFVRDDVLLATSHFQQQFPTIDWNTRASEFTAGLVDLFTSTLPKTPTVRPVSLEFSLTSRHKTISMDTWVEGDFNIHASRVFALDSQEFAQRIAARPGSFSLDAQLSAIPEGEFLLFDDDSATLNFPRYIQGLLYPSRRVAATHMMVSSVLATNETLVDVVDARDFLLGATHGGLVIELPDGTCITRTPYWHPFVNLASRASLPPQKCAGFTRKVLELNAKFFGLANPTVNDFPEYHHKFWEYIGFTKATDVATILTSTLQLPQANAENHQDGS